MPARETQPDDPRSSSDVLRGHGGQLAAARLVFPDAPHPWIDLSTGIAPHPYPFDALPSDAWRRLPDAADLAALEAAARACYGVPPGSDLVAAPGTQAVISLLPRARPARRVAILGFGYQEHPAAWQASGAEVAVVSEIEALFAADVAVVINPNNPDGRRCDPRSLVRLAEGMAHVGRTLVVDEAFVDTLPRDASLAPRLVGEGALVLRSFGKFFGLAGIRLGFAMGDPHLCAAIRTGLGPWAVSGPAIAIGTRALADAEWQADARSGLVAGAERLDELLRRAGMEVAGGTALFRLGQHPDAAAIFARLGRAGILVRPFRSEPTWLRFGLPADEAAWTRLARALAP